MIHAVGTGPQKRLSSDSSIVANHEPVTRWNLEWHGEVALRHALARPDVGVGLAFAVAVDVAFDELDRGGQIRTGDPLLPKQVRYQAAPRPVGSSLPPALRRKPLLASATVMADVQPLRALHYDPSVAGPLSDVVAPPYDVIDAAQRAELIARSPVNVVAV